MGLHRHEALLRARLAQPEGLDTPLEEFAELIGVDLDQVRAAEGTGFPLVRCEQD